ncbi:SPOR domain-containing protein [Tropicimonas isoalkanivorans]|uniref:Sporulation related domain-containing protein n=1 Tax=Tropicimonas isoalkanivorans TaxID=441112 RepID=A0A1I1QNW2_9RHOB|nr:SPOR domain-containing protein [Tropicimonas isoalkanivorans]SFD23816.1 Sporulation related domain-containing protein [Tropicimonas isoalkanivorans]
MMIRTVRSALLATAIASGIAPVTANAQTGTPAELPPASFEGTQYVDSSGCAFVRAELNGATAWIPRMTRERTPVCGMAPTSTAAGTATVEVAAPSAPAPAKAAPAATTTQVAQAPAPAPAPSRKAPRAKAPAPASPTYNAPALQIRCPDDAPVMYRKANDGKVTIWCSPAKTAAATPRTKLPTPPAGYTYAFDEGQYNPDRGERTAEGSAQMNRVWTNDVPQKLAEPQTGARLSTMAPASRRYVQVGTYAVPSNAQAAVARLQQAGLPAGTARYTSGGRELKVVVSGPFATEAQVRSALTTARRAGFTDAFPRQPK